MSVSTEVQRTLVKSPPELWTELSSPDSLSRHLSDFGEIRIVNTEPETKVEWEGDGATGTVQLKQSGWGTKVTLSVTRNPTGPEQSSEAEPDHEPIAAEVATDPKPAAKQEPEPGPLDAEPEPSTAQVALEPTPSPEPDPEPIAAEVNPDPAPDPAAAEVAPEPEPQLGFFARLFRKRKAKKALALDAPPAPAPKSGANPEPEPAPNLVGEPAIEVVALASPEPVYPDPPRPPEAAEEPAEDLASELESLEDQMAAETTELLTGVLDRLGAAHHRPFSRG